MIPSRAALGTAAAALVLSGCGVAAAVTAHTTTVADVKPAAPVAPAAVSIPHLLRPLPVIVPTPPDVVARVQTNGSAAWIEILNSTGTVVAKTAIDPTQSWMTAAGAGGAYWTQNGAEHVLTVTGAVRTLGPVPAEAEGVVIAPDGVSYAYSTRDTLSDGSIANQIVVVHPGAAPQVIADKGAPTQAKEDADNWDYYLVSWTNAGIAFARVPFGGCGCGSFDMQMQSAYSAIVDPVSDGETTVTADTSCPLSDIGPALESVCFAGINGTDAIRIASAGQVIHTYALSGKNDAGDALFSDDGSQLAYITIPVAEDQCGATITSTLRVMNLATGATINRAMGDFTPAAWSGGLIYGTVDTMDASGDYSGTLVAVNSTTLAVTQIGATGADRFVGII